MPTYSVPYPSSSHSHRSRSSRHSRAYSTHAHTPSQYLHSASASNHYYLPSASHGASGYPTTAQYDTGVRRSQSTGGHGHRARGSSAAGYYYPHSSSRSYAPQYAQSTSGHRSQGYGSGHHQRYGGSHGYSHQPQYYDSGRSHGQEYSRGYKPTFGQRLKWMFGMGHNNANGYHDSGKPHVRSRSMHDSGRRHDDRGRQIYAV